ncbi:MULTISPECIES: DUF6477 family protein [Halocynthiibacter]|uniref:DUF6477 family protein n=1 Tax=Halocynthiibacter halioticoli TaxID=2986804 RepID=A0AAE3J0R9_9RHOB|nr:MULTISPECIES: DUF6477 family protein [Halocynthiibacter]MCV6824408.1 DUF6477 family protein [Halocynthiibacter halioticoli]MCW4057409.1 DUF6477 family protein [Halocynthiibacter sp. SDUM655004]
MNDIKSMLKMLHRPRILIRAARHGLRDYNRTRDLKRLLRLEQIPSSGQALITLINEERALENKRKSGEASYSVMRHIEVLVALMGEAQLYTQSDEIPRSHLRVVG